MEYRQRNRISRSGMTVSTGGRRCATALLVTLAITLSGCALQQSQNTSGSVIAGEQGTPLGENLNGFLSQSAPGATVVLEKSPWGNSVEVMADASYFAASGRECRHLQIMNQQSSDTRFAVACKTADGSWVSQRLVTQTQAEGTSR